MVLWEGVSQTRFPAMSPSFDGSEPLQWNAQSRSHMAAFIDIDGYRRTSGMSDHCQLPPYQRCIHYRCSLPALSTPRLFKLAIDTCFYLLEHMNFKK